MNTMADTNRPIHLLAPADSCSVVVRWAGATGWATARATLQTTVARHGASPGTQTQDTSLGVLYELVF